MIPTNKALVLWNVDSDMKISELRVVHIDNQTPATNNLAASMGASDADWLDGHPLNNPMGLFLYLICYYGFPDRKAMIKALEQFATIEGEEEAWVKEHLARIGEEPKEAD